MLIGAAGGRFVAYARVFVGSFTWVGCVCALFVCVRLGDHSLALGFGVVSAQYVYCAFWLGG